MRNGSDRNFGPTFHVPKPVCSQPERLAPVPSIVDLHRPSPISSRCTKQIRSSGLAGGYPTRARTLRHIRHFINTVPSHRSASLDRLIDVREGATLCNVSGLVSHLQRTFISKTFTSPQLLTNQNSFIHS